MVRNCLYLWAIGLITLGCRAELSGNEAQQTRALMSGVALVAVDGTGISQDQPPKGFPEAQNEELYMQSGGVMSALFNGFKWAARRYVKGPGYLPEDGVRSPLAAVDRAQFALCFVATRPNVESIVLAGYSRGVAIGLTALRRIHMQGGCEPNSGVYPKIVQFLFIENVPLCIVPGSSEDSGSTANSAEATSLGNLFRTVLDSCADLNLQSNHFKDGVVEVHGEEIAWGLDWLTQSPFQSNNDVAFDCLHLTRDRVARDYGPVEQPWTFPPQTVSRAGNCRELQGGDYRGTPHQGMGFSVRAKTALFEVINQRFADRAEPANASSPELTLAHEASGARETSVSCPEGMTTIAFCSEAQTKWSPESSSYFPVYTQLPPSRQTAHSSGMARNFKVDVIGACSQQRDAQSLNRFALVQKAADQVSASFGADPDGMLPRVWIDANLLECRNAAQ